MTALLSTIALIVAAVATLTFWMSVYVFWEEAIQKNIRWVAALIGPPTGIVCSWSGSLLVNAVAQGLFLADWFQVLAWVFVIACPIVWLIVAVRCWDVVRQAVGAYVLSLVALGVVVGGTHVFNTWINV